MKIKVLQNNKTKKRKIRIIVIVIVLIIFSLVIFSGWMNGPPHVNPPIKENVFTIVDEESKYWIITIAASNGGRFKLTDVEFDILNEKNNKIYEFTVKDANPEPFIKRNRTIYPIPSGNEPVRDNSTGNIITEETSFESYKNCCIVFSDSNSNNYINADDSIIIFKNIDEDSPDEIFYKYHFRIIYDNNVICKKKL